MHVSSDDFTRPGFDRGPAVYFGYCGRTGRYRMMDLPEYVSNVQQGVSRWFDDMTAAYRDVNRTYSGPGPTRPASGVSARATHDCRCHDCHCECCVCDADVLAHARCGELRRIPVTFENDTRRERPVTLELGRFVTAGGHDLGWKTELSETTFTLRPCDERTVVVTVQVRCEPLGGRGAAAAPAAGSNREKAAAAAEAEVGRVDRCEVAYGTLRAEGCLVRPVVIAVAVLPDDCGAYRRPCGCGCCR